MSAFSKCHVQEGVGASSVNTVSASTVDDVTISSAYEVSASTVDDVNTSSVDDVSASSVSPATNRLRQVPRSCGGIFRGRLIVATALSFASLTTNAWINGSLPRSLFEANSDATSLSIGATTTKVVTADAAYPPLSIAVRSSVGGASQGSDHPLDDRITFVCEMSWEMGNMLSFIAYCAALAAWLERDYQIRSDLVLHHNGKGIHGWEASVDDIRACFPRLSGVDFALARTREFSEEFKLRMEEQERGGLTLSNINHEDRERVKEVLSEVASHARRGVIRPPNGTITLPFLAAKRMLVFDYNDLLDLYFDEIRELLEFDSDACCASKPYPDETVFHLRNFKTEVNPEIAERRGFKELGPKQTANDLLGHLRPGDRVAVLSRFSNDAAHQYVAAMRDRGLVVRFIEGQTARQDFCFLLSTQKEMVGVSISSYFYWAARLSNARRIVTYSLDIPSSWSRKGRAFLHHNYTHPRLKGRWVFRLFVPDESSNATLGRTVVART